MIQLHTRTIGFAVLVLLSVAICGTALMMPRTAVAEHSAQNSEIVAVNDPMAKLDVSAQEDESSSEADKCRRVRCVKRAVYGYKWITAQRSDGTSYFKKQRYIKYYRLKCRAYGPWFKC